MKMKMRRMIYGAVLIVTGCFAWTAPAFAACDAASCPDGCCFGALCLPGTGENACGTGGVACQNCESSGRFCAWTQECVTCAPFISQESYTGYGGILSTNFTMDGYDIYDAYSADDFTVPADARWVVDRFDFGGCGTNGGDPAHAVGYHVLIYPDDDGRPAGYPGGGAPLWSEYWADNDPRVSFDWDYHQGIRLYTGDAAARLFPGHYWVMIYLDWTTWDTDVFWYWTTAVDGGGDPAMYINPGEGWDVGADWLPMAEVVGSSRSDLSLALANCGASDDDDDNDDDDNDDDDSPADDDDASPNADDDDAMLDDDNDDDDSPAADDDDDDDCGC